MFARRGLWAGLFAAILLLGAVEWHPAGESHDVLVPRSGEICIPEASHPGQPSHFDAALSAERPVCPACLHQLRTSGGHLLRVAAIAPPTLAAAAPTEPALLPAGSSRNRNDARGLPSIS